MCRMRRQKAHKRCVSVLHFDRKALINSAESEAETQLGIPVFVVANPATI